MENKPNWYKGPGWYVTETVTWCNVPGHELHETQWLCCAGNTKRTAVHIAAECGYRGTVELIDLEAGNE